MSSLGKWQIFSIISRFSALVVGLLQSVIITRITRPPAPEINSPAIPPLLFIFIF